MKRPIPSAAQAPKTAFTDPLAEVLRPGQSIELLKELHILTRDGKLNQDSRRKLKQVYHLCNFIEPLLDDVLGRQDTLTLADHGAGKSYLGFILYDLYLKDRAGSHIYGIETRDELVEKSRQLAARLGFPRMSFLSATVAVGEYISIADEEGAVEEIKLFNTVLSHPDRSRVVIPNRKIVGEILHNFGTLRQLDVVVGVAYDTDIKQALAAIHDLLAAHPKILHDPEPMIRVLTLSDSSVNIAIRPWVGVDDFYDASSDITRAVLETFRERGIHIPFPQREVRLLGAA